MLKALAICLVLTTCFLAQAPECPELEVLGPQWMMMRAKEPATFVLRSGQDEPESFRYVWSVENGTITSGQGTRVVEVVPLEHGTNVRVTVTVTGFPSGCPNSASEIIGVEPAPHIGVVDEWGELQNDDQRGRLDVYFSELANNPNSTGVIIIHYAKVSAVARRRLKLYVDHARSGSSTKAVSFSA